MSHLNIQAWRHPGALTCARVQALRSASPFEGTAVLLPCCRQHPLMTAYTQQLLHPTPSHWLLSEGLLFLKRWEHWEGMCPPSPGFTAGEARPSLRHVCRALTTALTATGQRCPRALCACTPQLSHSTCIARAVMPLPRAALLWSECGVRKDLNCGAPSRSRLVQGHLFL